MLICTHGVIKMIGERIKKLREEKGFTQKQFSEEVGININTLASYERETREPGIDLIIKFANYFNVTTDYLIGASDYINAGIEQIGEKTRLTEESLEILSGLDVDKKLLNRFFDNPYFPEFMSNLCIYASSTVSNNLGFAADLLDATEAIKSKISTGEDASGALEELTSLSHKIYNTYKGSEGTNVFEVDVIEDIKQSAINIAREMKDANNINGDKGDISGNDTPTR